MTYLRAIGTSAASAPVSFALVLMIVLAASVPVQASVIVETTLNLNSLQITPAAGTVVFLGPWTATALADARNSLGEVDSETDTGLSAANASALVNWADAHGDATAPPGAGSAIANIAIPGCIVGSANSTGRGGLENRFRIDGGSGSVAVTFSAFLSGRQTLTTDSCGERAESEIIFALEVDGAPAANDSRKIVIGPGMTIDLPYANSLTGSNLLEFGTEYSLYVEVDAEALGVNTPEPNAIWMVIAGLAGVCAKRLRVRRRTTFPLAAVLLLTSAAAVDAKYLGGSPFRCTECEQTCPSGSAACKSSISLTDGNFMQDYHVVSIRSSGGTGGLELTLVYNSYLADGSLGTVDTVLGYGWTHSYNVFLFPQRSHLFRLDGTGTITKFARTATGYRVTPGYMETLVRNQDGSYTIRQKDGTTFRFESIPGTRFVVAGPVYRLTSITDRNENVTVLTYADGNLARVTEPYGRSLHFTYTPAGKLASVTDPLDRTTTFGYDSTGRALATITDPARKSTRYAWNSLYQLTEKIDRDGRRFTYHYRNFLPWSNRDSVGAPIVSVTNTANWAVDDAALATELVRLIQPSTTTKFDGLGQAWRYEYDKYGRITREEAPDKATRTYTYSDAVFRVSSITDARGYTTTFEYDGAANLIRRTDPLQNSTTFTYEPKFSQVTSITDPNNRVTRYEHDERGNRTKEIDPRGHTRKWTYDARGNVLSEEDKREKVTEYEYDEFGNRIRTTDALGNSRFQRWDAVGNLISETDALGHTTDFFYDPLDRLIGRKYPLGHSISLERDGEGNITATVDENGGVTEQIYDYRGRLVKTTDPMKNVTEYTYDANDRLRAAIDPLKRVTRYEYDQQNRQTAIIDARDHARRRVYDRTGNILSETDQNNHTTRWTYDPLNRKETMTDAAQSVWTYGYDRTGGCTECTGPRKGSALITKVTDPNRKVTWSHYDGLDRLVIVNRKEGDVADIIDSSDAATRYTYDENGNGLTVQEPNGIVISSTWDALNRLETATNGAGETTRHFYDNAGNRIRVVQPNGNEHEYVYDARNRVISVRDAAGPVADYTYDARGNRRSARDGNGNPVNFRYDALHRLTKRIDATGASTDFGYDAVGNRTSITDPDGRRTEYRYDALNRQTLSINPLGHKVEYRYDPVGNLIRLIDANGHGTEFGYDPLDRLIQITYPDPPPNTITYAYDAVGNRISRRDQKGQVTAWRYNDLYFMTTKSFPGGSEIFKYDLSGRLLEAARGAWLVKHRYDGANRLLVSVQNGKTVSYSYEVPMRLGRVTYPGSAMVTRKFDLRGNLGQIEESRAGLIARYTFDPGNRVVRREHGNRTLSTYEWNVNDWLTSIQHRSAGNMFAGFSYSHDKDGNSLTEQRNHMHSDEYSYDGAARLTGAASGPVIHTAWSLDPLGNWAAKTSNGVTERRTHNQVNEIVSIDGVRIGHDDNGNTTADAAATYEHDEENRLSTISRKSDGALLVRYEYDALGRRVSRADSTGVVTRYFYDGLNVIEEQSDAGVTGAVYYHGAAVNEPIAMDRSGRRFYMHQNGLRSISVVTNAAGEPVEGYHYDPYGKLVVFTPGANGRLEFGGDDAIIGGGPAPSGNPYTFTAQRLEDGLYNFKARAYSASHGRFIQRDPIGYGDSENLYEYVLSRPVRFIDPYGLAKDFTWKADFEIGEALVFEKPKLTFDYGKLASYEYAVDIECEVTGSGKDRVYTARVIGEPFHNSQPGSSASGVSVEVGVEGKGLAAGTTVDLGAGTVESESDMKANATGGCVEVTVIGSMKRTRKPVVGIGNIGADAYSAKFQGTFNVCCCCGPDAKGQGGELIGYKADKRGGIHYSPKRKGHPMFTGRWMEGGCKTDGELPYKYWAENETNKGKGQGIRKPRE